MAQMEQYGLAWLYPTPATGSNGIAIDDTLLNFGVQFENPNYGPGITSGDQPLAAPSVNVGGRGRYPKLMAAHGARFAMMAGYAAPGYDTYATSYSHNHLHVFPYGNYSNPNQSPMRAIYGSAHAGYFYVTRSGSGAIALPDRTTAPRVCNLPAYGPFCVDINLMWTPSGDTTVCICRCLVRGFNLQIQGVHVYDMQAVNPVTEIGSGVGVSYTNTWATGNTANGEIVFGVYNQMLVVAVGGNNRVFSSAIPAKCHHHGQYATS